MPAPNSDLNAIRVKVRRLTQSPSENQLTTQDLDNYINTFVIYDFPEHLRTFNLRRTYSFYTNPGQDVYGTDTVSYGNAVNNPLYDFQNKYISVHSPVFIAGYQQFYTQDESQFFSIYPKVNSIASTGLSGDGVSTTFTGNISFGQSFTQGITQNITLLQNNVLMTSIDANNGGLGMVDVPVIDTTTGYNTVIGNLYSPSNLPTQPPTVVLANNHVNYLTGVFTVTFNTPPAFGQSITSQTVPLVASLPQAMMYYGNQFTVRPIPDQVYKVTVEVFAMPTFLASANQEPALNEYWQYIAYGAAKKIFEDRMDMDSVQSILPEFKMQQELCLRRSLVQWANERTATIYTEQTDAGTRAGGWGAWGGPY